MYPGEIIIVIISSLSLAVSAMTLFLVMKNNKTDKSDEYTNTYQNNQPYNVNTPVQNVQQSYSGAGGNIVFCKRCSYQFDSSQRVCPYCGTPR